MVGIEVARSTTELRRQRSILQSTQLLFQTIHENLYLLTQTGGRSRLAVGLGQHRHLFPRLGIVVQLFYQLFHERIVHLLERFLYGKRYTGIVDILRGKTEMDELLIYAQHRIKLFLDEVLHGLHVVVGHLFNILHPLSIGRREVNVDVAQLREQRMVEILKLWQRQFAERNEILNLYPDSIAHKRILRKKISQRLCLTTIAAINRRDSRQNT